MINLRPTVKVEYKHIQVEFTCRSALNVTELKEEIQSSGQINEINYTESSKLRNQ